MVGAAEGGGEFDEKIMRSASMHSAKMSMRNEDEDAHTKCCTIYVGDFLRTAIGRQMIHEVF